MIYIMWFIFDANTCCISEWFIKVDPTVNRLKHICKHHLSNYIINMFVYRLLNAIHEVCAFDQRCFNTALPLRCYESRWWDTARTSASYGQFQHVPTIRKKKKHISWRLHEHNIYIYNIYVHIYIEHHYLNMSFMIFLLMLCRSSCLGVNQSLQISSNFILNICRRQDMKLWKVQQQVSKVS